VWYGNSDADGCAIGNGFANGNSNGYSYTDGNAYSYSYSNSNSDSNCCSYGDCHSYAHTDAYGYGDSNSYGNTDLNAYSNCGEADADAEAASNNTATAAVVRIGKWNSSGGNSRETLASSPPEVDWLPLIFALPVEAAVPAANDLDFRRRHGCRYNWFETKRATGVCEIGLFFQDRSDQGTTRLLSQDTGRG
jgi:hypothetical protein